MKNNHFFKVLLMISIINSNTYSMMRIPANATNSVIAQISKISKKASYFVPQKTNHIQFSPQIKLTQSQIANVKSTITQDLQSSSTNKMRFKPFIALGAGTTGMFKPTSIKLMSWNYKETPQSILEITSKNITEVELKVAYKKMALKHHPDQGGKKEIFIKVKDAYEYLIHQLKTGQFHSNHNNSSKEESTSNNSYDENNSFKDLNSLYKLPQYILDIYGLSKNDLERAHLHDVTYKKEFTDIDGFKKIKTLGFKLPHNEPLGNFNYFKNKKNVMLSIDLANHSDAYEYAIQLLKKPEYFNQLLNAIASLLPKLEEEEKLHLYQYQTKMSNNDRLVFIVRYLYSLQRISENLFQNEFEEQNTFSLKSRIATPHNYTHMFLGGYDLIESYYDQSRIEAKWITVKRGWICEYLDIYEKVIKAFEKIKIELLKNQPAQNDRIISIFDNLINHLKKLNKSK